MKKLLVRTALGTALLLYAVIISWFILTGEPGHMMAAALLAAAPLVVAQQQALSAAHEQRNTIEAEIKALRADLAQLLNKDDDAIL